MYWSHVLHVWNIYLYIYHRFNPNVDSPILPVIPPEAFPVFGCLGVGTYFSPLLGAFGIGT